MCGINGFISKNTSRESGLKKLENMNQCIIHRGPDDDGFYDAESGDYQVGFAMRRLSIIDLSSGKQPIYSDDGSKVIVFNGEIYNFKKLKADLENKGVKFHTKSDTEVILKLYEEYGVEAFKMLDGMFVFSLHDKSVGKVFIVRDFFGEKPLYYTEDKNKGLIWASELKSLMKVIDTQPDIDPTGLALFLQLTFIPAPYTIYKKIYKLEANHYIEFDLEKEDLMIREVAKVPQPQKREISFPDAQKEINHLVQASVLSRSVSDVPIGTFLSGGVDSSIVSWCLAQNLDEKINTFSVGFDKKSFDETDKSKTVANLLGSNHHEFILTEKDISKDVDKIILNFDEPFADSSALPSFLVAQKTSEFVKVALTGDGGDEVFGGYNKYMIGNLNKKYTNLVPQKLHSAVKTATNVITRQKEDERGIKFKVKKLVNAIDYGNDFFYNIIKLGFSDQDMTSYLKPEAVDFDSLKYYKNKIPSPLTLSDFREVDKLISLEGDMLVKVDRTSMLTSLECRAPFLNKDLWNYTNSLPENYLIKGNNKKYILKKAFEKYFPENFLEKSKQGFGVPVGDWLRTNMRAELESYINHSFLQKQGLFSTDETIEMVKKHLHSVEDHSFKVWTFFCFQKWYVHNILKIN